MANWQRKSEHLLRENVKFQTYVDSLAAALKARETFYEKRKLQESSKGGADTPLSVMKDENMLSEVSAQE